MVSLSPTFTESRRSAPSTNTSLRLARGAVIALLIFGLAFAGWWATSFRSIPDDESRFLPTDAELIALGRPAELWSIAVVRETFGRGTDNPVKRFAEWTGLRPEQVHRFALVAYRPAQRRVWAVVRTNEPIDTPFFERLPEATFGNFGRQRYVVASTPDQRRLAYAIVTPRLLVLGDEESVRLALSMQNRRLEPSQANPLATLTNSHQLAISFILSPEFGERIEEMAGFVGGAVRDLRAATLRVNIDANDQIVANAELTPDENSTRLVATLKKTQALAAVAGLTGNSLLEMIGNSELQDDGNRIHLRAEGQSGRILPALAEWAKKFRW
ncbi:MAG: hypothetical protein EBV06_14110 [Planctomycetia bacterium]|nr:hypothetical protein [Planctomycetia bacterium]